jgi:hypothetical protein
MASYHEVASDIQQSLSASEQSYQRARHVLETGLEALGGLKAIAAITNFTIVEDGTYYEIDESPSPDPPTTTTSQREETTIIDFAAGRLLHNIKHIWLNYTWRPRIVIDGSRGFRVDMWSKVAWSIDALSLQQYPQLIQKLPHFLLLDVLNERAASLRWLGDVDYQGQQHEAITYINRDGQQVALYFNQQTHLLTKYEFLYTDCRVGDSKQELIFPAYQSVGDLQVPTGLVGWFANELAYDIRYERVEINGDIADSLFTVPEGIELLAPSSQPMPSTITKIADDVYMIPGVGNYNIVLALAFDDYIVVVEAPETRAHSGASEKVIATVKATFPGNGCGLRPYIAEGTTIVTTPANQQFVERLAGAPFLRKPDALARNPRQPIIELIRNKKHVIRDDRHVLELYDIGPYWHANEELIVYLPQAKLLYEGDLFTSGFGDSLPTAQENGLLLAEKIEQLGLDVETIVGVHGRPRPIEALRKSIERRA